jgi:hypothetical protein
MQPTSLDCFVGLMHTLQPHDYRAKTIGVETQYCGEPERISVW